MQQFKNQNNLLIRKFLGHLMLLKIGLNRPKALVKLFQKHSLTLLNQLSDIVCVDTLTDKYRFQLIYVFYSVMYNYNVFIKYPIKEGHTMPSLIKNFASSN
jgi:NADH:ubiquinone oxidoreductase subunit C